MNDFGTKQEQEDQSIMNVNQCGQQMNMATFQQMTSSRRGYRISVPVNDATGIKNQDIEQILTPA